MSQSSEGHVHICCAFSPRASRPPSPKSDTEAEMSHRDTTSQTDPTYEGDEDDLSWEWGEVPHPTETVNDSTGAEKKGERTGGGGGGGRGDAEEMILLALKRKINVCSKYTHVNGDFKINYCLQLKKY